MTDCLHPEACRKINQRSNLCRSCHSAKIANRPDEKDRRSQMMKDRAARFWDWLPDPSLRAEYEALRDGKVPAAEAKRIILESYRPARAA